MIWILGAIAALIVAAWLWAPREPVDREISFDPTSIGTDIDAYLADREAALPDITPGAEKRVVWAGTPGAATEWVVLYVHGFSATSEEIRPVPDNLANGLGANLVFTRLTGHGRGGSAMAEATASDWIEDMAEAMAVARRVGQKVLVVSTSTGGTLTALAATDRVLREGMAGIVFVSPNFGLANPVGRILNWPFARVWGPLIAGRERSFEPRNEAHQTFWTIRYPTVAVLPMAALVAHTLKIDFSGVEIPALFMFSDADRVVSAPATRAMAARWGGQGLATLSPVELTEGDDTYAHVIAGDVLSPGMTETASKRMLDWAKGL